MKHFEVCLRYKLDGAPFGFPGLHSVENITVKVPYTYMGDKESGLQEIIGKLKAFQLFFDSFTITDWLTTNRGRIVYETNHPVAIRSVLYSDEFRALVERHFLVIPVQC